MQTISCDVLIVGAGPAGSTVGKIVAETGADVVIIDRRKEVGMPLIDRIEVVEKSNVRTNKVKW